MIGVGFLMADAVETVAKKFPDANFAIIDYPQADAEGQAGERARAALQGAGGRLPRRLPRRVVRQEGRHRRRSPRSAARRSRRSTATSPGYQAGAEGGQPGHQDAERLLAGLRRPGEVQGDRARPDRPRLGRRLPGGRAVRPRRAGRRRRRRASSGSASTPTRATSATTSSPRAEKKVDVAVFETIKAVAGRHVHGRRRPDLRRRSPTASGSARSRPQGRSRRARSTRSSRRSPPGRSRSPTDGQVGAPDARWRTTATPAMAAELALELRGITKRFGALTPTTRLDFELREGRSTPCWARTAPGKSTLMNVLYGILQPDEGEILVDGQPGRAIGSPRDAIERRDRHGAPALHARSRS